MFLCDSTEPRPMREFRLEVCWPANRLQQQHMLAQNAAGANAA